MDIVGILTGLLTGAIAIIGYFIKKHIESVEKDVKSLSSQVSGLKQDTIWLTNNISELKDMQAHNTKEQIMMLGKLGAKTDEIKSHINQVQDRVNSHEKHLENYGQVIRLLANKK